MPTTDPAKKRAKEQRKYQKRKANNSSYLTSKYARRTEKQNLQKTDFLAYDGEGYNGKYVLLANSHDYIYNPNGLSTLECLIFLTKRENTKSRIFFFFSYDINCIVRDIPDKDLIELFHGKSIQYHNFTISYIARKIFRIRLNKHTYSYFDTGTFFMCSFISALQKNNIEVPEIIKEGKSARGSNLQNWQASELIEYNRQECILLEKLLDKLKLALNIDLFGQSLTPKRWYGPGAIADLLLNALKVNRYTRAEGVIPEKIQDILPYAFFGGRIEAIKLGMFRSPIYSYDIRSAYPYSFSILPEISTSWQYVKTPTIAQIDENPFSLWFVSWAIPHANNKTIGPLPFRDKDGFIYFPANGKGFYYGVELATALKVFPASYFNIEYGYIMYDRGTRPFKENIEYLYKLRQELKEKKDSRELALKLSLNSMYGKTIQSVGSMRFKSLIYAGLITAIARSKLLYAAKDNILDIISFQTDGIKSLSPIKVETGKELGQWEEEKYTGLQILGAGIYRTFTQETINNQTVNIAHKNARGFNLRHFHFGKVCEEVHKQGYSSIVTQLFVSNLLGIVQSEAYGSHRCDFAEMVRTYNPMNLSEMNQQPKKREFNFFGFPDFYKENYSSKLYYFEETKLSSPYGIFKRNDLTEEIDRQFFELETLEG